jgi:hypothetical protein
MILLTAYLLLTAHCSLLLLLLLLLAGSSLGYCPPLFLLLLHLQPRYSLSSLSHHSPPSRPRYTRSPSAHTPAHIPSHSSMPLVVATQDIQLSSPDDPFGPRSAHGPVIPSPPPSPKATAKSNALFETAMTGNLRGFLDALSDPTVDVNILDGSKFRRNVLFCALVGTRSVRSVSSPLSELTSRALNASFPHFPFPPVLNTRARALRSVSPFSRPSSPVQNYLYTFSIHPFHLQMASLLSPSLAQSAPSNKPSLFWNALVC